MHTLIKIGLGLSLAIVYPFMVGFGIDAFYSQPKPAYEACRHVDPTAKVQTLENERIPYRDPMLDSTYKECYESAQDSLNIYNRNLFLLTTLFGFLAISIGTLLFNEKLGPVGPGLVFGGLFTILYGTTRSFRSLDKQWLFFELLAVFVGIIIVTWRYLQVNVKKRKK